MSGAQALAMNVAQRVNTSDEWGTPAELFGPLNDEFRFDLDVCASAVNAKCERYFTADDNGLWQPWAPARCWMNPPYGAATREWAHKAFLESARGALVVGLIPARTDTGWFHQYVVKAGAEIRFVRSRVRFELPDREPNGRCPFPSLVVVWRPPAWIAR